MARRLARLPFFVDGLVHVHCHGLPGCDAQIDIAEGFAQIAAARLKRVSQVPLTSIWFVSGLFRNLWEAGKNR